MTKKKWFIAVIILICAAIFLTIFAVTFKSQTGQDLPWWAFVAALVIFALIVYLVILLSERSAKRFETLLLNEGIATDRQYKWRKYVLYVDFESQRLANNYLSTRAIVPFDDVAGCRIESYRISEEVELPESERFLSLVLTLRKEGSDYEYQYLPVFEVKVEAEDVTDIKEVTAELTEKYSELTDMLALQSDVKKILEINAQN